MKEFVNKKTDLFKRDVQTKEDIGVVTFAELAAISLNFPPHGGWTTDEMRRRLPLSEKLSKLKASSKLLLENNEVDLLVECTKMQWKMAHQSIVDYEDYVKGLQKSPDIKVSKSKK